MTKKIEIDNELIKAAEEALEQYPRSVSEQIEKWIYLGKAASLNLTDLEMIELQLGNGTLTFKLKSID
jgi:hypothetical protein